LAPTVKEWAVVALLVHNLGLVALQEVLASEVLDSLRLAVELVGLLALMVLELVVQL